MLETTIAELSEKVSGYLYFTTSEKVAHNKLVLNIKSKDSTIKVSLQYILTCL
jgi:hypothetical protein